jgi:UDP-sugar transporter A1/2/3
MMLSSSSFGSIQTASVLLLIIQNTSLIILMKYSRVYKSASLYATTTAVLNMEILKLFTCFLLLGFEKRHDLSKFCKELFDDIFGKPLDLLKISIPAILFTIQNNLLYYAISHLDVITFQAISQLKILTTAIFSVIMLNKTLESKQWFACFLLTVGVTLTQISNVPTSTVSSSSSFSVFGFDYNWTGLFQNIDYKVGSGILAIFCACITSGFSSVYFEKILKNSSSTSIWVRNIQMSLFSIVFAFIAMIFSAEFPSIQQNGVYYGYNPIVITMLILQAIGGLIVALVMKYTDNIVKGFAASISIGVSWLICSIYFEYQATIKGVLGMVLIMVSVCLYTMGPTPTITGVAKTISMSPSASFSSQKAPI